MCTQTVISSFALGYLLMTYFEYACSIVSGVIHLNSALLLQIEKIVEDEMGGAGMDTAYFVGSVLYDDPSKTSKERCRYVLLQDRNAHAQALACTFGSYAPLE